MQKEADDKKKEAELQKRKKRYEATVQLNPDSATTITHNLDNKRVRITARGMNGKLYKIKYKSVNNNSVRINNKDTANLKIVVNQLPKLEESAWYKVAQAATRGLMMVRSVNIGYTKDGRVRGEKRNRPGWYLRR